MELKPSLTPKLYQLLNLSQDFSALLNQDRGHLKENDLQGLEKNNLKKSNLMLELATLIQAIEDQCLMQTLPGSFYSRLKAYGENLTQDEKHTFQTLLTQVIEAMKTCQQEMNFNRNILKTNLKEVKNLFSLLLHHEQREEASSTYDFQGKLEIP